MTMTPPTKESIENAANELDQMFRQRHTHDEVVYLLNKLVESSHRDFMLRALEGRNEGLGSELRRMASLPAISGGGEGTSADERFGRALRVRLNEFADALSRQPASVPATEKLVERIKAWAYSKPRKPAEAAFTAGDERQIAYMIEDAPASAPAAPAHVHAQDATNWGHCVHCGKRIEPSAAPAEGVVVPRETVDQAAQILEFRGGDGDLMAASDLRAALAASPAPERKT